MLELCKKFCEDIKEGVVNSSPGPQEEIEKGGDR